MQICSQTSLAVQSDAAAAARAADQIDRRRGGAGGSRAGEGGLGAVDLCVGSGVRGGAAAQGSKVHECVGGLRAGLHHHYRRRRGAEADSSGAPGSGGSNTDPAAAAWPCSPRPQAPRPGRGCAGSRIAGPCSWPLRGWARSPPPEPARLHSGRRLLPHPLQHVVYPVILDHHCAGRKRISRVVSGGGGESGARADLLCWLWSRDTTRKPMPSPPELFCGPYLLPDLEPKPPPCVGTPLFQRFPVRTFLSPEPSSI